MNVPPAPDGAAGEEFCDVYLQCMGNFDFKGLTDHVTSYCQKCAELTLKKLARENGDRELLFPDRLPIWIQREQEEAQRSEEGKTAAAAAEDGPPNRTFPAKPKFEPKNKHMGPEEVEAYIQKQVSSKISDAMLAYEIQKYKQVTGEEARRLVVELRTAAKKQEKSEAKEAAADGGSPENKNKKKQPEQQERRFLNRAEASEHYKHIPWVPLKDDYFPQKDRSVMSAKEQRRIVSIISSYIFSGDYRFAANKEDLKMADNQLEEERNTLNRMIVDQLNPFNATTFPVSLPIERYCQERQKRRFLALFGMRFYREAIEKLNWTAAIPDTFELTNIERLEIVQEGRGDSIRLPSLEDRLILDKFGVCKTRPTEQADRLPIEEDTTALKICLEKNIPITMDASTATFIMTRNNLSRPVNSRLVVSVRSILYEGALRKVIFVSKPKHSGQQNNLAFLHNFTKHCFKAQYVEKRRDIAGDVKPPMLLHNLPSTLQEPEEQPHQDVVEEEPQPTAAADADDPLGSIIAGMHQPGGSQKTDHQPSTRLGKRYSIFKIGSQEVLIRSSMPMKCTTVGKCASLEGKDISLETVVEWLPSAGAMVLEEEELLSNYCKRIFKQSDAHCIVRMGVSNSAPPKAKPDQLHKSISLNVLQIHPLVFFTDVRSADMERNVKRMFDYRAGVMSELLATLLTLEEGFFLLHGDKTLHISKEIPDSEIDVKNVVTFENKTPAMRAGLHWLLRQQFADLFQGIDHRIMLQWQIYLHRVPGAFFAADCYMNAVLNRPSKPKRPLQEATSGVASKRRRRKERAEDSKRAGDGGPSLDAPAASERRAYKRVQQREIVQYGDQEVQEEEEEIEDYSATSASTNLDVSERVQNEQEEPEQQQASDEDNDEDEEEALIMADLDADDD